MHFVVDFYPRTVYNSLFGHDGEAYMATICKLSEFGECSNEVAPSQRPVPRPREFCCEEHGSRYRYIKRKERGLLEQRKLERREMKEALEANGGDRGTPEQRQAGQEFLQKFLETRAQPAQALPRITRRI
jgi:hypothetical protein